MTLLLRVLLRLATFVVSLVVASVVIFLVCAALPGDVAQVMLGQSATPEAVETLREQLGLNRPLPERYSEWVNGLLQGDLGTSILSQRPVSEQVFDKFGVTLWLVVLAMGVALAAAIPLGMWAAVRRRHTDGFVASALSQIGLAIPAFWAGILLAYFFAVNLRWLPANGYVPLTVNPVEWFRHLVLPVFALALVQASILTRYVRSAVIEVLSEDYHRTARAVGWGPFTALARHGLRNASISVVTVLGLQLATLFVGAIVIESVFALPGLGTHLLNAVSQRDLVVVQGIVMLLVFVVLVINAIVDFAYLVLDPRLRDRVDE